MKPQRCDGKKSIGDGVPNSGEKSKHAELLQNGHNSNLTLRHFCGETSQHRKAIWDVRSEYISAHQLTSAVQLSNSHS